MPDTPDLILEAHTAALGTVFRLFLPQDIATAAVRYRAQPDVYDAVAAIRGHGVLAFTGGPMSHAQALVDSGLLPAPELGVVVAAMVRQAEKRAAVPEVPDELAGAVLVRDHFQCQKCDQPGGVLVVVPRKGWAIVKDNLVTLCPLCETRRGRK